MPGQLSAPASRRWRGSAGDRIENGDSTVVTLLDDLCVLCDKDGYEGGMFYPVSHMTLWERFEENPNAHVWLVDFHD